MNRLRLFGIFLLFTVPFYCYAAEDKQKPVSTKKERNLITKGNSLYEDGKYKEAVKLYEEALQENPSSVVGRYNLGLSEIKVGSTPGDTTTQAKKILQEGIKNMQQIANLGKNRSDLASKANYNLGNVAFNNDDYGNAIQYYKQALRLNPDDDNARRNLRIAQLKQQEQDNQDQNQDQDQDQDQNQDQDQDQEQNQDQDQDQDQNQDQDEQEQPQEQPQSSISQQAAEQILNAIENKENQTRARVANQNAEKSKGRNRNKKNW